MKQIPAVLLWSVAFAYVESAVVEYLRALYFPLEAGGFTFPLLTPDQFQALGVHHWHRLLIELGREFATLVMLAAVGLMAGKNRREAMAHFMIAFGAWDIFFYLWLKVFLDWPSSIMTWDVLFLLPVPWVGPVIAPVIISLVMIAAGVTVLFWEGRGVALATTWVDWAFLIAGGITVIVSLCWDHKNIMAGGLPNPFNWSLFVVGLCISSIAFLLVLWRNVRKAA